VVLVGGRKAAKAATRQGKVASKELIRLLRAGTRITGGSDGARTRDLRRDRPRD
jgi:hypothetical protein